MNELPHFEDLELIKEVALQDYKQNGSVRFLLASKGYAEHLRSHCVTKNGSNKHAWCQLWSLESIKKQAADGLLYRLMDSTCSFTCMHLQRNQKFNTVNISAVGHKECQLGAHSKFEQARSKDQIRNKEKFQQPGRRGSETGSRGAGSIASQRQNSSKQSATALDTSVAALGQSHPEPVFQSAECCCAGRVSRGDATWGNRSRIPENTRSGAESWSRGARVTISMFIRVN